MARGQDRLKEYQALSPRLKVEYVDPVQSPAKAQAYDVRGPWPILVVERGDKRERVTNDCEQDITNALIKITRDEQEDRLLRSRARASASSRTAASAASRGVKSALAKSLYETKKRLPAAREDGARRTARC